MKTGRFDPQILRLAERFYVTALIARVGPAEQLDLNRTLARKELAQSGG